VKARLATIRELFVKAPLDVSWWRPERQLPKKISSGLVAHGGVAALDAISCRPLNPFVSVPQLFWRPERPFAVRRAGVQPQAAH
jgi:hypothetical protein